MVLLTITPAAKTAIDLYNALREDEHAIPQKPEEPSLAEPAVDDPVTHGQLIAIAHFLQERGQKLPDLPTACKTEPARLDLLLKGSKIYTPPPKPKPESSSEYVALMARLRGEEEERAYERMINPPLPVETYSQRFPSASPAFAIKDEEDEVMYADVNRQLALIINVLVSIIACSIAIWIAARHWSVPQRLALSMTGSGLVAAAEIVIFSGYIRRVGEAKAQESAKVETKEVVESWVIDGKKVKDKNGVEPADGDVRFRKPIKGKHR